MASEYLMSRIGSTSFSERFSGAMLRQELNSGSGKMTGLRVFGTARGTAALATLAVISAAVVLAPLAALDTARFVLWGLVDVAPLVIPGILLAARVAASGASSRLAGVFERRTLQAVLAASAMGAVAPVCGVTVLPLMAGLLASGAPLAPVAAFLLSSPITDPAMLAATAAILGPDFAIAKTAAAFGGGSSRASGPLLPVLPGPPSRCGRPAS